MLHVVINGQIYAADEGETLLSVMRRNGITVPTLCHDERLKPYGSCRLCSVEVEGEHRPVSSCSYPVRGGLTVQTHSVSVESLRKTLLGLMAQHYPRDALEGDEQKGIERPFHALLRQYGVRPQGIEQSAPVFSDDSHPYLQVDMSRCISCYRCVRICDEVQGQDVWQVWNRGENTRIHPDAPSLRESACVSCGACADTCPTGAIRDRSVEERGAPQQWTKTTCAYCGTGCELEVGVREGRITQVRPSMSAAVNHGHACVKGRYAWQYGEASDRITEPLLRDPSSGEWKVVSWEEAYRFIADRLTSIRGQHGADAFGMLGSARASNEENYLAQKFARVVMGTNNVDCCARVCHGPSAVALGTMLGTGAATNHFDDIEKASLILVCGCNPLENHPVIGARIRQAVRRGASLIVIDPRKIELCDDATLHLPLKAGSNVLLFNAMAATIVDEGLVDQTFVEKRVNNFSEFENFIRQFLPELVAERCGVDAELIRAAARLYAQAPAAMSVHGLGMTEHLQGSEGVMCLVNLALLTGNIGRPGTGINPLRGQNNVQGSAHMGCEPSRLTGYVPLAQGRERFEKVWQRSIPADPGLNLMQMMDAAEDGRLKALWAFGYDIVLSLADRHRVEAAMQHLELVVVQDLFLNETARQFAHVFLPAASNFEKDGTFMNADRRVQRIREALPPRGNSRPDWQIFCELADVMGQGAAFAFGSAEAIWKEVRQVWLLGAGMSYERLENESLHWPCPDETHPGTAVLHETWFAQSETAALALIAFEVTPEQLTSEFPLRLVTGRGLYHFNAGTMSYRTPNAELVPDDVLEVSAADAHRMALNAGRSVRLISRHGEVSIPWRVSDRVKPGELYTTFHNAARPLNWVTSPVRDNRAGTPEYKVTAVRLEQS